MGIDLLSLLSFIVALWLVTTLGMRIIPAASIAGGVPLAIKAIERYAATHFYPEHTTLGFVLSVNDIATAIVQFLVALLVFLVMQRLDDSITNYILVAVVGGIAESMIVPAIMSALLH